MAIYPTTGLGTLTKVSCPRGEEADCNPVHTSSNLVDTSIYTMQSDDSNKKKARKTLSSSKGTKVQIAVRNRRARNAIRKEIIDKAKSSPCVDCGNSYIPYVMDLDHVRGHKLFNLAIANALNVSMEVLLAEIDKCDPVCSNCHRIRTWNRSKDINLGRPSPLTGG